MGIIDRIFSKQINQIAQEKAMQVIYKGEEQYNRMLFNAFLGSGMQLLATDSMKSGKDAFKNSTDVYSIISKIVTMASQVEWCVYDMSGSDKIEVEDINHPLVKFLKKPNTIQSFTELYETWHMNHLLYGNGIVYYPTLKDGNNKGKLMNQGAFVVPSNVATIKSGGVLNPIEYYNVDYSLLPENNLPVEDVIHTRMLNVYDIDGQIFWGLSPISVAASIIQSQINGIDKMASLFKNGIPPGILTRIFEQESETALKASKEDRADFKKAYQKNGREQTPFYGVGKHEWIPFTSNLTKDLELIQSNQNGTRLLCNVFSVPSQLFNDPTGQKYDNMDSAKLDVWEHRIIPDQYKFCEKLNEKIKVAYPTLEIWPEYSHIKALQTDKEKTSKIYIPAYQAGLYTKNEVREKLDDEEIEGENGDSFYDPLGNSNQPDEMAKAEEELKKQGVNDYKK